MPMDFPDMESLKRAADVHGFRQPHDGEDEHDYRMALAEHVRPIDLIESQEIKNKVGWDKFSEVQNMGMILDAILTSRNKRSGF